MKSRRRDALWAVRALPPVPLPLFEAGEHREDPNVALPNMTIGEEITHDYATLRLSLKTHPLALLREELAAVRVTPNEQLVHTRDGTRVTVAGIALVRQLPGTASGIIFITLEDETGVANLVVYPDPARRQFRAKPFQRQLRLRREAFLDPFPVRLQQRTAVAAELPRRNAACRAPSTRPLRYRRRRYAKPARIVSPASGRATTRSRRSFDKGRAMPASLLLQQTS